MNPLEFGAAFFERGIRFPIGGIRRWLAYPRAMLRTEPITSLEDPRVADYRNLRDFELRRQAGLFMVEGRLNVRRLLMGSRFHVRSIFATEAGLEPVRDALASQSTPPPVYLGTPHVLEAVAGFPIHRGCLAVGERGQAIDLEALLGRSAPPRLWLALEDVQNADNVGGIFRSALAFGAGAVVINNASVDPLYRKSIRVSMGAALHLPFASVASVPRALEVARRAGFLVFGMTTEESAVPLHAVKFASARDVLLVVGNEQCGLSEETRKVCGERVVISMVPEVDSLNAATAAAIALHHMSVALATTALT